MNESISSQSNEPAPPVKKALRVLLVEDSEIDATLLVHHLEQSYQLQSRRVQDAAAMKKVLQEETWDVVLCDYWVPGFGVAQALEIMREDQLDLAFIVVSGAIGEDLAVETMKAGAHDYIMKGNLTRLVPAIEREIRQAGARRERTRTLRKAAWLAAIVDSMGEAVIGTDPAGIITSWNAGAERLYGYAAEEAIGKAVELVVPPALHQKTRRMLEEARQGGQVSEFETTVRLRRDGTKVDVSSAISAVKDETGQVMGAAILAVDITERKEAEEERKKMIQELTETLAQVRSLRGLLPICSSCKKIRDEKGHWQALETYISGHSQAEFSHSICPSCAQSLYSEFMDNQKQP
ncbi:MAG TPA: PAS domain S-box protein [Candidatus Acidoferrum sp.]|nr:PAS domain S-box protein [Candidatus Acidoferrum sp.]